MKILNFTEHPDGYADVSFEIPPHEIETLLEFAVNMLLAEYVCNKTPEMGTVAPKEDN